MKAFIITLKKIPESLKTAKQMVEPLKRSGFNVKLFEGTYGDQAYELFRTQGRILHPVDHNNEPTKLNRKVAGAGAMGCFYSHYRLWKKCVNLNETIFIFEDDVKFYRPYYPVHFDEVLLVALGSWKDIHNQDIEEEPKISPTALSVNIPCLPGAVGYAITPNAAKKLIDEYKNTYTAADSAIRSNLVDIKVHSHLMGRALVETDGKISLTNTKMWDSKDTS